MQNKQKQTCPPTRSLTSDPDNKKTTQKHFSPKDLEAGAAGGATASHTQRNINITVSTIVTTATAPRPPGWHGCGGWGEVDPGLLLGPLRGVYPTQMADLNATYSHLILTGWSTASRKSQTKRTIIKNGRFWKQSQEVRVKVGFKSRSCCRGQRSVSFSTLAQC